MLRNWQLPDWPKFGYNFDQIAQKERQFLLTSGSSCAFLQSISKEERDQFIVETLEQP